MHGVWFSAQVATLTGAQASASHVEHRLNLKSWKSTHDAFLRHVRFLQRHPIHELPWPLPAPPTGPLRPGLYPTTDHSLARYLVGGGAAIATHSNNTMLPSFAPGAQVTMYTDGSTQDAPEGGGARPTGAGVHTFMGNGLDDARQRAETERWLWVRAADEAENGAMMAIVGDEERAVAVEEDAHMVSMRPVQGPASFTRLEQWAVHCAVC